MPIPLTKVIGGQRYRSTRYTQSKKQAQQWAKEYRKRGVRARVTQLGSSAKIYGVYRNYWIVWI